MSYIFYVFISFSLFLSLAAQEKALKDYVIPNEKFDSLNNVWIEEPVPFVEVYEEIIDNKLTGNKLLRFADVEILVEKDSCKLLYISDEDIVYIAWNDSTLLSFERFRSLLLQCKTYKYSIEQKVIEPVRTNYTALLLGPRSCRTDGKIQDIRILSGDMILIGDEIKHLSRYQRKLLYEVV